MIIYLLVQYPRELNVNLWDHTIRSIVPKQDKSYLLRSDKQTYVCLPIVESLGFRVWAQAFWTLEPRM